MPMLQTLNGPSKKINKQRTSNKVTDATQIGFSNKETLDKKYVLQLTHTDMELSGQY